MTCMTTPIHYEFCVQISESVLRRRYNERQKKSCSYNYTYNYRRGSEFTLSMWSNKLVIVTHTNALEMYLDCDIPHSRVSFRVYMVASGTKRWIVCVCALNEVSMLHTEIHGWMFSNGYQCNWDKKNRHVLAGVTRMYR